MFGIGETELVLIVLFAFMVFGPDKLPGMGRTLGRALRQFRNAQEGFTEVVQTNIMDPAAEAMSDSPKRPNRKRAEALEEDSDLEVAGDGQGSAPERHAETFAERKKRLAEEKRAREEAEAAQAAADDEDADDAAAGAPDSSAEGDAEPAAAPEPAPAKPTAADLYAMRPPHRAAEQDSTSAEEGTAADAPADTTEKEAE